MATTMANPLLQGSKSLVVKDNKLINAHYSMSVLEMRLFLAMVVQVHKDDRDFKTYKVRVRDLMDAGGGMSENIYHRPTYQAIHAGTSGRRRFCQDRLCE